MHRIGKPSSYYKDSEKPEADGPAGLAGPGAAGGDWHDWHGRGQLGETGMAGMAGDGSPSLGHDGSRPTTHHPSSLVSPKLILSPVRVAASSSIYSSFLHVLKTFRSQFSQIIVYWCSYTDLQMLSQVAVKCLCFYLPTVQ